jgi:DNA-binding transcriptional MerR regulator
LSDEKTLAELSEESGIPARTIRFYISRGLLQGPVKAGRGAAYTPGHLARLKEVQALQADGRTLAEIAAMAGAPRSGHSVPPASAWWQHRIDDDVVVWTRADVSPWRMKMVRDAIDEMAARLASSKPKETRRQR